MRSFISSTVLVVLAILLVPGVGLAGELGDGACVLVIGEDIQPESDPLGLDVAFLCADLTSPECDALCPEENAPVGDLTIVTCEWFEETTCEEGVPKIGNNWEGACTVPSTPIGNVCFLVQESLDNWTAEGVCTEAGGLWDQGGICGAPVPALPRAGLAVLVLALMLGTMVVLNTVGSTRLG